MAIDALTNHHPKEVLMKNVTYVAVSLLLVCSLTARAAEKREQTFVIGADVNAQGHLTATQVDPGVSASVAALLSAAVKQWQFVPATRDGHAVSAHTFVYTRLQASPNTQGQYNLRISFLGNGPDISRPVAPRYPRDAIRAREGAFAILDATVQPDGHLSDMSVSSQFANWPLRASFKSAVLTAAQRWHATPEQVEGQPVATHVRVPVDFSIDNETFTRQQIEILREAARKQAATAESAAAQPGIPLPSEQAVALDSPLQPRAVATIISAP
ncbi:energy transducer TonB [Rhodanobacter sp. AS-Z3]|uniref:energy transducer TonB n=1 Tax=Rhodanobacter sp. AS-Z3 TaxID=3031330 RepID=UPI002479AC53|nr:energy transducer TonB [Rhodanobacter sp. AS-Z3]WEN15621.1 energy transducer TonB [Rhodanobacter sp. AS-Z3]